MLGGIAEGDTRHQRLSRRRGLPGDARGARTRSACASSGPVQPRCACTAWARDGLHAAAGALDMGNAGTAMRLFMGLLAAQPFDSTLIGDASLMRRPMERVAAPLRLDGRAHRTRTRAGRRLRSRRRAQLRAIEYELPVASAQVKSAILLAALCAEGRTRSPSRADARSHRAHAARLRRAGSCKRGRSARARGRPGAARHAHRGAGRFLLRGVLPGRRLPGAPRRRCCSRNVGHQPDPHRACCRSCSEMGADIRIRQRPPLPETTASPSPTSRCAAARLRGITVPAALVPLAIDEFPVFFIAAACARGRDAWCAARAELRVKESDRLAVMAAGLDRARRRARAAARWPVDPGRRRASAAAPSTATAITASPWPSRSRACARARPHRDPGRRQCRDLLPGFVRTRARGGLADRAERDGRCGR